MTEGKGKYILGAPCDVDVWESGITTPLPFATLWERTSVPVLYEADWAPQPVQACGREKSSALPELNPGR